MKGFFSKLKEKMGSGSDILDQEGSPEYVELSSESSMEKAKILVRPYTLENFEDVKPVLDALREGHTLALVNIRPLKDKDLVELKRAINKIKKTCDAIEGDIAGLSDDYIVVAPHFAQIWRQNSPATVQNE